MRTINRNSALAVSILLAAMISGCGSQPVESSTWLMVAAGDTLTVGELGEAWSGFDDDQRSIFLDKENTVGEFIVTYGRKILLQKELESGGYLEDPALVSLSESWARERMGEELRRKMYSAHEAAVTQEDVDFFMENLGRNAFFTTDPEQDDRVSYGPVHIPSLPDDMIGLLDSLTPGATGTTESGMVMRLDSIVMMDSATMAPILADSAALRAHIISSIANRRFEEEYEALRESLVSDLNYRLDTTALSSIGADTLDPSTVVMRSDVAVWTMEDFLNELNYYSSNYSILNEADMNWLATLAELIHYNRYAMGIIREEYPGVLDSLEAERESYLLDIASESIYADSIKSGVTVTEEAMRDLFENMEEPLTIPEKRVLQAVRMPRDTLAVWLDLPQDEQDELMSRQQGFANLAADPALPQITKPLTISEVPGFNGEDVFLMDPTDTTTWLGPKQLYGSDEISMFRLLEVIPERNATFEEVEDQLRIMTRNRLEEQATVEYMRRLEERYGLVINDGILRQLPEDPGLWSDL